MLELTAVQDYAEQIAEAIATVVNVDIEIADRNLIRIAGTGRFRKNLGHSMLRQGFVYKEVLRSGQQLVIEKPREHELCVPCKEKDKCSEMYEVVSPINVNGSPMGVIGLICSTEKQVEVIRENLPSYLVFFAKMAETIAIKLKEQEFVEGLLASQDASYTVRDILGNSKSMCAIREQAEIVAASKSTILIRGESGTGKEMLARAIHNLSPRSKGPFVAINCTAIPETLLESELFGYEDGAFTGAHKGGKIGKFELANHGTLFLDEIGDMPLFLQTKILRALQERQIERIGGEVPIQIDVRVISATHRDLEQLMLQGEFRDDLFYRINVIPMYIEPLRNRKEDLEILCDYFIKVYNQQLAKNVGVISEPFRQKLWQYSWPGNVRELQNVIEYAMNLTNDETLDIEHLPAKINQEKDSDKGGLEVYSLEILEREAIRRCLQKFGHSVKGKEQAAKALGIGIATLYRKMAKYEMNDNVSN